MARRIRFILPEIRLRPRSYGNNVRAVTLPPSDTNFGLDAKAAATLHPRGNDYPDVVPASRRVIDRESAGGAREWYTDDIRDLNSGPPPAMIRRNTQAADSGTVWFGTGPGPSGRQQIDAGTDPGALYIPHQRIPRTPITVTAFRRTIDSTSTIPARGIGAPVKNAS